ncbi:hypothetical protein [Methylobacterium sp. Leaf466]|uniref:calcium-binding protein n=1 Tax=Methylobacterium sp. Leaf466 TaxID=1736386 RepID=UPI0006FF9394|nr:hypothetical protein [Methylobacterium sp. Leaf466]KQT88984.1 hypothetical protein ASG59_14055 [Methylobacterium sp. Leaf466]
MFDFNRDYTTQLTGAQLNLIQRFFDDQDRTGFQNLDDDRDVLFLAPSTRSLSINAQGGNDIIDIGSTSSAAQAGHTVYGGTGNDTIQLGSGNDTVYAGFDDDSVEAGLGNDLIYGGQGNDYLVGDSLIFVAGGNDTISGGSGNDRIIGLRGADDMTGGSGADTFIYFNHLESAAGARDEIFDFNRTEGDKIDLHAMDADLTRANNQDFTFSITGPSTAAGSVWATGSGTDWTVFVNVDGGAADMAIDVTLAGGTTDLARGDFIL